MKLEFRGKNLSKVSMANQPPAKPNSDLYSAGFVMFQRESARITIQMFCDVSDQG